MSIGLQSFNEVHYYTFSQHGIQDFFQYLGLPYESAFLAGKCFLRYRRAGGRKRSPLPDFFIGAHAAVENMVLLTRDATRYRTYFPGLQVIAP